MQSESETTICPLCKNEETELFFADNNRSYFYCCHCRLVFVPETFWLTPEEEKATYDLHENDARDDGYRRFLSRLATPLLARLEANQRGLDFGCGPGPALPLLLEEQGHQVARYDPWYCDDPAVFSKRFDFICATEVVEHLHDPDKVFTSLFAILKPNGWLGIMTKLARDKQAFSQWHYIRDLTHICFYHRSTFEYLAQRHDAKLDFVSNDVILLNKN